MHYKPNGQPTKTQDEKTLEQAVIAFEAKLQAIYDASGNHKLKEMMVDYLKGQEVAMMPRIETIGFIRSHCADGMTPFVEVQFTGSNGALYSWETSPKIFRSRKLIGWTGSLTAVEPPRYDDEQVMKLLD